MRTQTRSQYGVFIVEPDGRIVGSDASELREVLMAHVEASDDPRILINFRKTRRIDSIGLGMLVDVHIAVMRKNGHLGVVHLTKHIRDVIVATRIIHLLELFDSEDTAVSALSTR